MLASQGTWHLPAGPRAPLLPLAWRRGVSPLWVRRFPPPCGVGRRCGLWRDPQAAWAIWAQHQESSRGLTTFPGLQPLSAPSTVLTLESRTHLFGGALPAPPRPSCVSPPPPVLPFLLISPVQLTPYSWHLRASLVSSQDCDCCPGTGAQEVSTWGRARFRALRPSPACWAPGLPFSPQSRGKEPRCSLWPVVLPMSTFQCVAGLQGSSLGCPAVCFWRRGEWSAWLGCCGRF